MRLCSIVIVTAALVLGTLGVFVQAQTAASVWDGVYADAQAARGEAAYAKDCASCHGTKLEGRGPAAPLAGPEFNSNWDGMTVGDLFSKIQSSMPADQPGRLTPVRNAEILAYMLKMSEFPAGSRDLDSDPEKLNQIRFEKDKPKR